jgi:3' exoribonuclease, RNase T-like
MKKKYFLDCEFIENGKTIDLLSIALVCEDGREYYAQNADAKFEFASDWVWRNVFPHLREFNMRGIRSCSERSYCTGETHTGMCHRTDCAWRNKFQIRDEVRDFMDTQKHGTPEVWGYYSAYDWVAFCQLFGAMIDLPKGYPMFCRDIIQECKRIGNPELPKQDSGEHNCLEDARWNKRAYEFLRPLEKGKLFPQV